MDRQRPPTIYDVAKAAGVSPSTVSRAFSRPGRVGSDTAAHIKAVAKELGYRASPVASALSTSRSWMLAFMVADVANPVFAAMVRGAQAEAAEAGFVVLLEDARESGKVEREALERVLPAVEGVVLGGSRMSDSAIRMLAKQKPVVVLNREVSGALSVVADGSSGVRRALDHLAYLGHSAVTYASGPEASWANGTRLRAFREHAQRLGLSASSTAPVSPTVDGGTDAASVLLKRRRDDLPTAIVAYNDLVAAGIVRTLREAGVVVPRDVSVVGFDDILVSQLISPPLTTVASPLHLMGAVGVRNVIGLVKGAEPRRGSAVVLPSRLVVRGSTGPRRQARTSVSLDGSLAP